MKTFILFLLLAFGLFAQGTGAGAVAVFGPSSGGGGGSGTVTSVSVVTANGVSGSVANATTTPAITLTLGAIAPASVNGNIFTTGTYTLTGSASKTLNFTNSLTLTGTDGTVMTFPTTSASIARMDAAQSFTGTQTFASATSILVGTAGSAVGSVGFRNATSGTATIAPPTGALGTYTVTLPNAASILPILGQQITFAGPTAARTVTFPDAAFTVARTDAAQTFTGNQTMTAILGTASTAVTQSPGDNSTKIATTAYVAAASGTPGGSTTQVQFNLSSAFAGDADLTFVTDTLTFTKGVTTLLTNSGTEITTGSAMGALAISVTNEMNTKSISADSTFTFSGTPGTTRQWFGMEVTNSDTSSHILTIPSSFSVINGQAITTLTIGASSKLYLIWNYDGSVYNLYGDPTLVGTVISSSIATGSAVSLTTATPANVTNIVLTPGTWSVVGSVVYKPTAATSSRQDASVNSTSATLSTTQGAFKTTFFVTTVASVNFTNEVPEQIITVTSNTTYYLVAQITFSAGTMAAFGELHATRIK